MRFSETVQRYYLNFVFNPTLNTKMKKQERKFNDDTILKSKSSKMK